MRINQYLRRIEQGHTINLDRFIECLPYSDSNEWRKVYRAVRVRDGYQLTIDDADRHRALYMPEFKDRISASTFGRSHDFPSSFAHILVLNHYCKSQIPFVVVSDNNGFRTEGKLVGKRAVIIENTENFYRYREFLEAIGHSDLTDSCDIFLGAGNQICHHLNLQFLSRYDALYCAQDLELGGLTIYQTLKKSLPQCNWLAPVDWEVFRNKFRLAPKKDTHLAKAIKLARELGLNLEADLMNQTRHFLEQEAFLPALTQD